MSLNIDLSKLDIPPGGDLLDGLRNKLKELEKSRAQMEVFKSMGASWTETLIPMYDEAIEKLKEALT